jgi:DNA uptake protein ComE-like DNA-binding protein
MNDIKKVTPAEASAIIESREPKGMFYCIEQHNGKQVYVGIDNSTGDAWTEDKKSLAACKRWLKDG